ncbi:MAG: N-acetylmuramoyl-L-alanine amidase, partial [Muribaculaceae bacterium]|nr:N-acetylmuramoyl-L-alanine amidase [Muribaculaceae bacterium]
MKIPYSHIIRKLLPLALMVFGFGCSFEVSADSKDDFVVVIDAGHGGKDYGAVDNNANEKSINLEVAQRVAELINKKMKDTKVVMTRNSDIFVSLQGRADIANKSKGDLFISIHTNSVDLKNKNRASIAGASVYTLGPNKDEANKEIARRENAVIEMESSYRQKYSGFDPNKDESYIIFEMAQKKNLAQSNRFAKMVQDNLVKIAGRKDRGVKQAGFWVLWSTSMPAVLVELDFICNPESAKFMTSKEGVEKLADAIFQAVKTYEHNYRQSIKMAENESSDADTDDFLLAQNTADTRFVGLSNGNVKKKSISGSNASARRVSDRRVERGKREKGDKRGGSGSEGKKVSDSRRGKETVNIEDILAYIEENGDESYGASSAEAQPAVIGIAYRPAADERDKSHSHLDATRNQRKPRTTSDGRRRRSSASRRTSDARVVEGEITLSREFTGESFVADEIENVDHADAADSNQISSKDKKGKNKKKSSKKISTKKYATQSSGKEDKSSSAKNRKADPEKMKTARRNARNDKDNKGSKDNGNKHKDKKDKKESTEKGYKAKVN